MGPPPYEGGPLEVYDDWTKYSLVDHHDGYEIHLFYGKDSDVSAADVATDVLGAVFGVPTGSNDTEFDKQCEERIYSVAQQYADKNDQLQRYMEWERAKRLSDMISTSPKPNNEKPWSMGKGIRYETSDSQCHAYSYFRWKAHASK
jgi:hypothetical protein